MMKVIGRIVLVVSLIGIVFADIPNDLEDGLDKFRQNAGIDDLDLPDFDKSKVPPAEEVEKVLKDKCSAQGHEGAVQAIKNSQNTTKACIEQYINFTKVQDELMEAQKSGSMEVVFGKYCKMWPDIYKCVENVTVIVRECMEEKEQKAFNKSLDILSELQEFMCFKDGDRLAMFVAEGGVECLQEKKVEVQNCINSTVGNRFPNTEELSVTNLPVFLFSDKDCDDFDKIRECMNTELEKCENSTPANIVDAFLKFLKKQMPCQPSETQPRTAEKTDEHGAASSISITSSVFLVSLLIVFN